MPAYKGSAVIIKIGNGGGPEIFTTIGGLRTSRLTVNHQVLNSTNKENGPWRQLLGSAGIRSMAISGSGMFTDSAAEDILRGYALAGSVNNYQFVFANGDYVTGSFLISSYERGGDHDREETFSIALTSAGAITFMAA